MSTDYRFGKTDVSCEGYRDRHDPYVLKGSCGLEYTLEYTDQGKARVHQQKHPQASMLPLVSLVSRLLLTLCFTHSARIRLEGIRH